MRALFLRHSGGDRLHIGDYPEPPAPIGTQVRFRVIEGGICGTDRANVATLFGQPAPGEEQLILGHEAVGVITEIGERIDSAQVGDIVVPMVRRPCRQNCRMCMGSRRDNCLTGDYVERGITGAHGYFSEFALDAGRDLILVPPELTDVAVLVEPASVVEKSLELAQSLHKFGPRSVLILGAGAIGILAAWAAIDAGFDTTVYSLEPAGGPKARLLEQFGVRYTDRLDSTTKADIILEAAGNNDLAVASLQNLNHCGVQIVLGARGGMVNMPYIDLILRNQIIAGCVNAARKHFIAAVDRLGRLDRRQLDPLIHRYSLDEAANTIARPDPNVIKPVHRIH